MGLLEITLETTKLYSEVAVSIATCLAILAGGYWTYSLFIKNRQKYPRAEINHSIYPLQISGQESLIRVDVIIKNLGNVLLQLSKGATCAYQFFPIPEDVIAEIQCTEVEGMPFVNKQNKCELDWPILCRKEFDYEVPKKGISDREGKGDINVRRRRKKVKAQGIEIEPGEEHELNFDLVVPSNIESVLLYTYIENVKKKKREIGWSKTTFYEIKNKEMPTSESMEVEGYC
ncbi:MAG: hypothetical protein SWK76_13095 [Actinomycetota bacterium]|nr:hypothetical protein [Actinomycetota bacterium]